jgi:hypothetical protein
LLEVLVAVIVTGFGDDCRHIAVPELWPDVWVTEAIDGSEVTKTTLAGAKQAFGVVVVNAVNTTVFAGEEALWTTTAESGSILTAVTRHPSLLTKTNPPQPAQRASPNNRMANTIAITETFYAFITLRSFAPLL